MKTKWKLPPGMTIQDYVRENGLRILSGHGFLFFLENLDDLPGNYLEIGVFEGVMLRELAKLHPGKIFYGIDPFIEDGNTTGHTQANAPKGTHNLYEEKSAERNTAGIKNIKLFKQTSRVWAQQATDEMIEEMNVGSVFVDGDHSYEETALDLALAARLLINGGLIFIDDIGLPTVQRARDEFAEREALRLVNYHEEEGIIRLGKP